MRRLALVLFITLIIGSIAFIVGTVGQLPPRVASRFGGAGLGGFVGPVLAWQALFYLPFRSASPT
jgi:hypothetical protein